MKSIKKLLKRFWKKISNREFVTKFVVVTSSLALLATSVLPFILG